MRVALLSVFCRDRTGLVAAITGRLFELGANLGDTSFAVLAGGAEFRTVCEIPDGITTQELQSDLADLPTLAGADIQVQPFHLDTTNSPAGRVTHRILVSGGDRPGLIARLTEVLVQYQANIVRLDAHLYLETPGSRYVTRLDVALPERGAVACLATIANTAGELGLACQWELVGDGA